MTEAVEHGNVHADWWFVTRKYPPATGGMERLSFEITTRLSRRQQLRVIALRPSALRLPGSIVAAAARVLAGCIAKRIVLLHVGDPVLAPLATIARVFGVPTVVTIHGLDVVYPSPLYRAYLWAFLRDFDAYVCISYAARRVAIDAGVPPDRIHVIGIGVDAAPLEPDPGLRDDDRLLFIGRLVRRKGLEWFVRDVLPRVARTRPALRLVILGDGPERGAIEAEATAAGVAANLVWLGSAGDSTKADELARATVCVMPNVPVRGDIEGFGIVALEAAAAGCPLLASRLEGLCDAVTDGESGLLVPPGDDDAWVDALERWLADPKARADAGTRARQHVAAHRTWKSTIDAYERLLLDVTGAARAPEPG